jgi:prevent-host-death family protein
LGYPKRKSHFSALIDEVAAGQEIFVTKKGVPVARILPCPDPAPRTFGIARELFENGEIVMSEDFDAPLTSFS